MKQRAGQEYGERTPPELNFDSMKVILKEYRDKLPKFAIRGSLKYNKELEDIDRVLKLIETKKFKINGKFEIEKTLGREGKSNKKMCWESVHSIGSEIEANAGKQGWATCVLQEVIIKNIAQEQGLLISDKEKKRWGKVRDEGTEAKVYNDPDDKTKVIKTIIYLGQSESLPKFFERTTGFNALFPETKYDIVGFIEKKIAKTAYGRNKMLQPVLKQPFVSGKTLMKLPNPEGEFEKFLQQFQDLGYDVDFEMETITKDSYEASDLNWRNVIKFENQYYVIDAWVEKSIK
ncbi:MAG: hypothetical protein LBL57_05220 [Tannerella sp.]|jgi:hypothetical protein|nr:hypothetical protein [Tannerella sp.]